MYVQLHMKYQTKHTNYELSRGKNNYLMESLSKTFNIAQFTKQNSFDMRKKQLAGIMTIPIHVRIIKLS